MHIRGMKRYDQLSGACRGGHTDELLRCRAGKAFLVPCCSQQDWCP